MKIVYFHRHLGCGFSINKVTQTIIHNIPNRVEFFVPARRATLINMIKNIIFIYNHRQRNAINHISGDIHYGIIGLIGVKSVLTIHDTIFVDHNNVSFFKRKLFELLWYKIPIKFATKVVCISEVTKESIKRFTSRNDIIVIHNAIDESIQYRERVFEKKDEYRILIIGTAPNKNLIRTFNALRGLPIMLTVVGKMSDEQISCLSKNEVKYQEFVGLTDNDINDCYANNDLVCFCTLFEGFGMPILEANRSGCPILCSDIPVMHEVGGDSVAYVDPLNVYEIHERI